MLLTSTLLNKNIKKTNFETSSFFITDTLPAQFAEEFFFVDEEHSDPAIETIASIFEDAVFVEAPVEKKKFPKLAKAVNADKIVVKKRLKKVDAFIQKWAPAAKAEFKRSKILPSVKLAQAIVESAWGTSKLSVNSNNFFGMKAKLGKNSQTTWDKKSQVAAYDDNWKCAKCSKVHHTPDRPKKCFKCNHSVVMKTPCYFRKYKKPEQNWEDHSYFLMNERYDRVRAAKTYQGQAKMLKACGYATSHTYSEKLCKIIEKYELYKFD
jgi:flagellum-specific peptidoglycan hydrolase FlgJ